MKGAATVGLTRLGGAVVLSAALLAALATLTADSWLLLLAAGAGGLQLVALAYGSRVRDVEITVRSPARAVVGAEVATSFTLHNRGRRRIGPLVVRHERPGLADAVVVVAGSLRRGQDEHADVACRAMSRGRHERGRLTVSSEWPFGLVRRQIVADVLGDMTVHPATRPMSLPTTTARGGDDRSARPDRAGLDVRGVREWRGGDDSRQVHWRSTARHGRLMVRERQSPRAPGVVVLVAGPAGGPDWEDLVSLVASTAMAALLAGRPVTLLAAQPGRAQWTGSSRVAALDWCAALGEPSPPAAALVEAAARRAGRGGQVLVAAPAALPATWWAGARRTAATRDVAVVPLRTAGRR